ncbi:rhomboid-like protein [Pseudonocardia acidicola]|uniref:Rhomboid family intramembrane serine protease n=1 Tax=Pseudonocardia acidicola TaxID=2724939 RepID=A0ABX1SFI1_9PSEU|nr:rhomboid-like protein [Pseudonocardia acidicola]NMI00299.1 hypothetical protein [Pseudonocardia acidicola]
MTMTAVPPRVVGPDGRRRLAPIAALAVGVTRLPVTVSYLLTSAVVATLLASLRPGAQAHVILAASTNLDNLSRGDLVTLVTSAFVTDEPPSWLWWAGVGALLAAAEFALGSRRLVTTFALGHVGATALVAVGLVIGIEGSWLPASLSGADDVGVSYGAAAVLGSLTAVLPARYRFPWAAGCSAVAVTALIAAPSFTAVGHVLGLLLGLAVAAVTVRRGAGTAGTRTDSLGFRALLAVGVAFVYAAVGGSVGAWWSPLPIGLAAGLGVAAVRYAANRRRAVRATCRPTL